MSSTQVAFPGSRGQQLAARLDSPIGKPRAYAVFAHCFTCSKDLKGAVFVAQALAARDIAVLRFDFTGLGKSGGDFADWTFSANIDDHLCAAEFLRRNYASPQILIGHSFGGAAVLAAAAERAEVRAVATIAAPYEPRHVEHLIGNRDELLAKGDALVDIGGRPFRLRRDFLADLAPRDLHATIATLRKLLVLLHSPLDKIVSVENAARIFLAAKHPKSFVSLDDADHLLTRSEDAAYAADVIAAWASRYLEPSRADATPGVRVVETRQGKFAQDVFMGRHRLRADEPEATGGADSRPNPYRCVQHTAHADTVAARTATSQCEMRRNAAL